MRMIQVNLKEDEIHLLVNKVISVVLSLSDLGLP